MERFCKNNNIPICAWGRGRGAAKILITDRQLPRTCLVSGRSEEGAYQEWLNLENTNPRIVESREKRVIPQCLSCHHRSGFYEYEFEDG